MSKTRQNQHGRLSNNHGEDSLKISKPIFIVLLIALNAIPIYGVFQWGWKSFDLMFLYWLENLIIGMFMVFRIIARRYNHPVELVMPLFMAPFFTLHYGMFCFGHGTFVVSLFGKGLTGNLAGMDIPEVILPLIEARHLFWPVLGLFIYQLMDWIRDTTERGFGSDSIKDLTTAPYRRIMILHITIIASGFAMTALNEPLMGLLLLIAFKTAFDIYNWNKDEKTSANPKPIVITEKIKKNINAFLDKPTIKVNGKEIVYSNFEELKASSNYRLMTGLASMIVGNNHLKEMEAYVEDQAKQRNK